MNRNRKIKAEKHESKKLEVLCSWCGAVISSDAVGEERMCVICHARLLNEYFHNIKKGSDEKQRMFPGASKIT